ncbi:MAG: translation initiation factor IF-2 [Alphaproteobacteria bacterium]|nr:translation initiation factor IF-2 [Alphaproteobacteria bacterium]
MTKVTERDGKKPLTLSKPGKLSLKKREERTQVEQKFPHGRRKTVEVEVLKKRTFQRDEGGKMRRVSEVEQQAESAAERAEIKAPARTLTEKEREARARALQSVGQDGEPERVQHDLEAAREIERAEGDQLRNEEEERKREEEEAQQRREEEERRRAEEERRKTEASRLAAKAEAAAAARGEAETAVAEEDERKSRARRADQRRQAPAARRNEPRRRDGKLTISQALSQEDGARQRSDAAFRRKQERERKRAMEEAGLAPLKIVREVIIPETITVQELAGRMAERGAEVVKTLMKMGVMVTITQNIDADTAELVATEFGHNVKRVSEADVEIGLDGAPDDELSMEPRAPVVTVMGHVDHGKTSLLDALRETDVAGREAGGITQHIGAYQVTLKSGSRITFLDTPGHEAFTAMRSRGAKVTDIVVLVVAADDGIQPQTVEAINHARAAEVPMIVAINKMDKPEADANRVRQELLQHEIVVEQMGGEVIDVEVSATEKMNLDKLEELILLQAEILELRANSDRPAQGVIIEAKLEQGRGPVATVLIERGKLRVGDIFIAGGEWGRVRALINDHGDHVEEAGPAMPVEVLGLNATPSAGDDFAVVDSEGRAREISEFRQRQTKNLNQGAGAVSSVEQMFSQIQNGAAKELAVVVKGDVQGSVEAIVGSLERLVADNEELNVRVLHAGVGGINESDVSLAKASNGLVIGFNVRANPQAREVARRDNLDVRYYSVIYDIIDDIKGVLTGMLAPSRREKTLGNAEIREVFKISKVGRVAGCMVTNGTVKRGARVRLLRDDVVIHEGGLSTLKRFKDDVREVKEGFECGLALENYQDIKEGDIIECYEVEEVAREL